MFARDEALKVWDDLIAEKDSFLYAFGELVFSRMPRRIPIPEIEPYGYFIRAKNYTYTKEMLEAYDRVCKKHNCTYRIEAGTDPSIIFYKL